MKTALKVLQWFSIALIGLIVISFFLAVAGQLPWLAFWILAALLTLCAYVFIPRIRKVLIKQ